MKKGPPVALFHCFKVNTRTLHKTRKIQIKNARNFTKIYIKIKMLNKQNHNKTPNYIQYIQLAQIVKQSFILQYVRGYKLTNCF